MQIWKYKRRLFLVTWFRKVAAKVFGQSELLGNDFDENFENVSNTSIVGDFSMQFHVGHFNITKKSHTIWSSLFWKLGNMDLRKYKVDSIFLVNEDLAGATLFAKVVTTKFLLIFFSIVMMFTKTKIKRKKHTTEPRR